MKTKKRNIYKGFTLIELIVVIAVLGILVLIASPKLTSYVEKTQLTRIQHDVKVMEQEMKLAMVDEEANLDSWDTNSKDLGTLVLQNKLFEKEGVANRVDKSYLKAEYYGSKNSELGIGGELITLAGSSALGSSGYKIIPGQYNGKIGTKLRGTFYTNENGKVYYENDKPLSSQDNKVVCKSQDALPNYNFDFSSGKIIKYLGSSQHLEIPSSFRDPLTKNCVPVRSIGAGAFKQGGYKTVTIPESVVVIESEAFEGNELTKVVIPHSVTVIGTNAFEKNKIEKGNAVIKNSAGKVSVGTLAFANNGAGKNTSITPTFKIPTDKDLGIVFDKTTGSIVSGPTGASSTGEIGIDDNTVVNIPGSISVGGVTYPVKQIQKGAYQGVGLISVTLPEGLEIIEDYAFSGNQLIDVVIPKSVYHIGNYAFSFNEQTDSSSGSKKASIKSIVINGNQQLSKLDKVGNIVEKGSKVDILDGKTRLLNNIFVTSSDNYIVDNKYVPNTGEIEKPLSKATINGSRFTKARKPAGGTVTWDGEASGKTIELKAVTYYRAGGGTNDIRYKFISATGTQIGSPFYNSYHKISSGQTETKSVVIPKGAVKISFEVINTYGNTGEGYLITAEIVE